MCKQSASGACLLLLAWAFLFQAGMGRAGEAKKDLNQVSMTIKALQALDSLELGPKQLEAIALWVKETASDREREPAKASPKYRKVLQALLTAIVKSDEKAEELFGTLAELQDSEEFELDDGIEITDAARPRAAEFHRLLAASQLAAYLGSLDISNPLMLFRDALQQSRELKGQEWDDARAAAVEEIAQLWAGLDQEKEEQLSEKISALLDKGHGMSKVEFKKNAAKLRAEARDLAKDITPIDVLRNRVELNLAELLSNPMLADAIAARQKGKKK